MSEQELLQCESMLKNLLVPDNNIRNQAQSQLADCLSSLPKKEALSIYSSLLLLNSTDLNVQTYCALILRKIFLTSDKEISNEELYPNVECNHDFKIFFQGSWQWYLIWECKKCGFICCFI